MADVEIFPPAATDTIDFTEPVVQTSEFAFVRPFAFGGAGRKLFDRTFGLAETPFRVKFARQFAIDLGRAAYVAPTNSVDTTLNAAAPAGSLRLNLASAAGVLSGMVLQIRPPYGERVVVSKALKGAQQSTGSMVSLVAATRYSYPVGTRVVEANLNHPQVTIFDKRGVLMGVIQDAEIVSPPQLAINTEGSMTFRVPRNSADRGLIADDRIAVIGASVDAPSWAGVIEPQDWSEGQAEVQCSDILSATLGRIQVEVFKSLPDNTLARTVAKMVLDEANERLAEDGQMQWLLDATGSKVYRDDVDYQEAAGGALEELRERSGVETTFRITTVRGRLVPYLVVRDQFLGYRGVTLSDGPDSIRYRDEVLMKGRDVVAYWRMGEATGTTMLDELGASNGGYNTPAVLNQQGALRNDLDTCVYFDGSSFGATVADSAALRLNDPAGFSIVTWVKPATGGAGTTPGLLSKGPGNASGAGWELFYNTSTRQVTLIRDNQAPAFAGLTVSLGVWNCLAYTYDGRMLRGYLNGQLKGSYAVTYATNTNTGLLLLARNSAGTSFFVGRIDDTALFKRGLSDDEVLQLYLSGIGASDDAIGNVVATPRVMRDPGEKINAVTVTGIETAIGDLLPDWARWAAKEIEPKVTVAIDTSSGDERRAWDEDVGVEWTLSKAMQQELADATLAKLWVMYQNFLKAWHDRYGRPFHEGWIFEGPPDSLAKSLTRERYRTRLQLVEYPVGTPASVVMSSMSDSKINENRWLIVKYDRVAAKQTVSKIVPSVTAGVVPSVTFAANGGPEPGGKYRLYKVAGDHYVSSVVVTISSTSRYDADATNGTYYNANLPVVKLRRGAYRRNGVYESDRTYVHVRTAPYFTAPVARRLSVNQDFVVRQATELGSRRFGTRLWYGDASGTRWVKREYLDYVGPYRYQGKVLRRIRTGPYGGYYVQASVRGVTFGTYKTNSSYLTPTENNPIIVKMYDFERQHVHLWDPARDGIGELMGRQSVFNGSITSRKRWQIGPWAAGSGSTTLLQGITASATGVIIESWLDLAIDETDGVYIYIGEGNAREEVLVTAQDGYDLTVVRGRNGTAAIIHEAGEAVALREPVDFEGFEFPYEWPEGETAAREYLERVRKSVVRVTVSVTATTPTDIGRIHTVRLATEGQGAPYDTVVERMRPAAYWSFDKDAAFDEVLALASLDGWWLLNEAVGDTSIEDWSLTAATGSVVGTVVLAGDIGPLLLPDPAAVFGGSGSISVPHSANNNAGTISFTAGIWFKTTNGGVMGLMTKGPTGEALGWALSMGSAAAGRVRFKVAGIQFDSAMPLNDGGWHLAMGVLDRNQNLLKLYVDGMMVGVIDAASISATNLSATDVLRIGTNAAGNNFVGSLAHGFTTRRALSAEQIDTLYRAASQSTLWDGTIADETGNGNTATEIGFTTLGFPGPVTYMPRNSGVSSPDGGTGQYTVPHSALLDFGTGSFTVAGWWYFGAGPDSQRSLGKGSPIGNVGAGWVVQHAGTNPVPSLVVGNGSANIVASCGVSAIRNRWWHLAWVVDRRHGQVFPYVNGVAQTPTALGAVNTVANTAALEILSAQGVNTRGVSMAHTALWNRALSEAEVKTLFNASLGNQPQPEEITGRVIGQALNEMAGVNELLIEVL